MRQCIFAAVATVSIGLSGTFGATALPVNGTLVDATTSAPELQKARYYHRHARRVYRRGYRRGYYYGGYYPYGGYPYRGYYCGGYYRCW
jgi:hypothetical protein